MNAVCKGGAYACLHVPVHRTLHHTASTLIVALRLFSRSSIQDLHADQRRGFAYTRGFGFLYVVFTRGFHEM